MKRTRIILLAALFISVTLSWPAVNEESSRRQAAAIPQGREGSLDRDAVVAEVIRGLQDGLPVWIKERDVPGVAVAVVDDEEVLWQGVYGHTSRAKDRPVTPRTLFSIQSMSKSFAALAVLMAVQDGLVDLDRPITDYLPDFTVHSRFEDEPERKMTLRHLLAHRAGFTHEAPVGGNYDSRPHTFAEHILSISDTWLRYPVGERYSYSNLGIDLAGWVLEKKSGVPFPKYVLEKVLAPLGMADSTLDIEAILKAEDRAVGHIAAAIRIDGGIPVAVPMVPAGGVYTNIVDMARYLMFHINKGRVGETQRLRPDLVEAMHTVQFAPKGERSGYGLGLVSRRFGPENHLTHGGGGYGFTSRMDIYPRLRLGVVVLTNSEQNAVVRGVSGIVNGAVAARVGPPDQENQGPPAGAGRPVPASDVPGPNKPGWKSYLGSYRTLMWGRTFGFPVNVSVADGHLTMNGARCLEHLPGLFFTPDGEALDFRGTVATFRNIQLIRTRR